MHASTHLPDAAPRDVDPQQLLYSLMVPAIVMPITGWMFAVSLPIIRDDFNLTADVAAWIATTFTLSFMVLMPLYGRFSDDLGKRRLLLIGMAVFIGGTLIATVSLNLTMLLIGRIVQGVGIAGILPLSLALITEVFPSRERGKAMGLWSTVGPVTGVIGPLLAGFIVVTWGWRASFLPPAIFAIGGVLAVYFFIPASSLQVRFNFLRTFDWPGLGLLSGLLTALLFYFSSRPITGVPPLQDWRLLGLTLLFLIVFVWVETRRAKPFINLHILSNRSFTIASLCACLRMLQLSGGFSFLFPLYLADVIALDPSLSGFFLMTFPLAMALVVRVGGNFSDRQGSRAVVMMGFGLLIIVLLAFSQLTSTTPYWVFITLFLVAGLGAGLMLASLHRAALNDIAEADLGTSSGLYSTIRFFGFGLWLGFCRNPAAVLSRSTGYYSVSCLSKCFFMVCWFCDFGAYHSDIFAGGV